ncbi:hypothetical protein Mapa_008938 [Marchantia paleacea]|nr:hypothetical protein Mapa_008938 [Marchantia paleacea]
MAKILLTKTRENVKPAPQVASFSSKGPNIVTPVVLKPDLIAPGVNVLAAWSPHEENMNYNILSGTSMSCPHIAASAALVKARYPTWSPAAVKSAIMTSASRLDEDGIRIVNSPAGNIAGPFDYGAGQIQPTKALQPGLIYDITVQEYVLFLCRMGYTTPDINSYAPNFRTCPSSKELPELFDLNYPSIAISQLKKYLRLNRRVKNVGPSPKTSYRAVVQAPPGIEVKIVPSLLQFNALNETLSFALYSSD